MLTLNRQHLLNKTLNGLQNIIDKLTGLFVQPAAPQSFAFNTQKHYKIWFSGDRDNFLGIENELLFINTVNKNPNATFSFVYSRRCLSDSAYQALERFCETHSITPIDFDTLGPHLKTRGDKRLYALANEEIDKTIDKMCGNLAGASDNARIISKIAEIAGIYSDFDVSIDFSKQPNVVKAKSPILYPSETFSMNGLNSPSLNNEFFACSYDLNDPSKLSREAQQHLKQLQKIVVASYQNPQKAIQHQLIHGVPMFLPFQTMPDMKALSDYIFSLNSTRTIYDYREFAKNLTFRQYLEAQGPELLEKIFNTQNISDLSDEELASYNQDYSRSQVEETNLLLKILPLEIKRTKFPSLYDKQKSLQLADDVCALCRHNIHQVSVMLLSGPAAHMKVFIQKHRPWGGYSLSSNVPPITVTPNARWNALNGSIVQSGLKANGLASCHASQNSITSLSNSANNGQSIKSTVGKFGHQAWTTQGKLAKEERETRMLLVTKRLQRAFRKRKEAPLEDRPATTLVFSQTDAKHTPSKSAASNTLNPSARRYSLRASKGYSLR